jgi:hypothetical protein
MSVAVVKNRLSKPIESLTINKEDLQKLLQILQERANSACELECKYIESISSEERLEQSITDLNSCSILKITINGIDNKEVFGSIDEVFDSLSFPDQIKNVCVSSELLYKVKFNYYVRNRFDLFIDFSKPKVLDFSILPSEETPNESLFRVEGYDSTWVNGVFSEIDKFFDERSSNISRIHRNSIYDLIVNLLGIPLCFWVCYKFESVISSTFSNGFMKSALFVYIFLFCLFILRILFHYFRWLYPKIQYKSPKDLSIVHRGFFYIITTGIIATFLYDILGSIF